MKRFNITVKGHTYDVLVEETGSTEGVVWQALCAVPAPRTVAWSRQPGTGRGSAESLAVDAAGQDTELNAPMPAQ